MRRINPFNPEYLPGTSDAPKHRAKPFIPAEQIPSEAKTPEEALLEQEEIHGTAWTRPEREAEEPRTAAAEEPITAEEDLEAKIERLKRGEEEPAKIGLRKTGSLVPKMVEWKRPQKSVREHRGPEKTKKPPRGGKRESEFPEAA